MTYVRKIEDLNKIKGKKGTKEGRFEGLTTSS